MYDLCLKVIYLFMDKSVDAGHALDRAVPAIPKLNTMEVLWIQDLRL